MHGGMHTRKNAYAQIERERERERDTRDNNLTPFR